MDERRPPDPHAIVLWGVVLKQESTGGLALGVDIRDLGLLVRR